MPHLVPNATESEPRQELHQATPEAQRPYILSMSRPLSGGNLNPKPQTPTCSLVSHVIGSLNPNWTGLLGPFFNTNSSSLKRPLGSTGAWSPLRDVKLARGSRHCGGPLPRNKAFNVMFIENLGCSSTKRFQHVFRFRPQP